MYIVEWYDQEGTRRERAFDNQEAAQAGAAALGEEFDCVAILWEAEI